MTAPTLLLIDARKTFVIGISLIFGLSVDLLPDLYVHFHPFKPLFSSSLALATVSALVLNLVFRLGISQRKQLILAPGVEASGSIVTFMETQGAVWGGSSGGDPSRHCNPQRICRISGPIGAGRAGHTGGRQL